MFLSRSVYSVFLYCFVFCPSFCIQPPVSCFSTSLPTSATLWKHPPAANRNLIISISAYKKQCKYGLMTTQPMCAILLTININGCVFGKARLWFSVPAPLRQEVRTNGGQTRTFRNDCQHSLPISRPFTAVGWRKTTSSWRHTATWDRNMAADTEICKFKMAEQWIGVLKMCCLHMMLQKMS